MATEEDAELKELVIQTLENNGVLAQIKAKLRASVFLALENASEDQFKKSLVNDEFQHLMAAKTGKMVASLVYDFLKHFKLEATLSVFESETQFSKLVPPEDFDYIRNTLNIATNNAQNDSVLCSLVKKYQLDTILNKDKISLCTEISTSEVLVDPLLNLEVSKNDSEQSTDSTVTDIKSFEENKESQIDNASNSKSKHMEKALKSLDINPKTSASHSFSLSSLNNAPPLPGMKGTSSTANSGSIKQKSSISSKQSGENEEYEDDFHSSVSLNSDEIEENISGNMDDHLSYEGVTEDECVTSDRTVSHISTAGMDYLESVKE